MEQPLESSFFLLSVPVPSSGTRRVLLSSFASSLTGGRPACVVDLTEPLDAVTGSVIRLACEPHCEFSGLGLDCDGKPVLFMRNGDDMKLVPIAGLSNADVQKAYRYVRIAVDLINNGDFEFFDCGVDEGTGCRFIDAYDRVVTL